MFADPDVTHVDGDVSPERDIETVVTELILADLQTLDKALPRLAKEAKFAKNPEKARTAEAAVAAQRLLDGGTPLSAGVAAAGVDLAALREPQLLTAKPFLYVFNMDTSELADEDLRKRLTGLVAPAGPSSWMPGPRPIYLGVRLGQRGVRVQLSGGLFSQFR